MTFETISERIVEFFAEARRLWLLLIRSERNEKRPDLG